MNTRQAHWARLPIPARGWVGSPRGPSPTPPASEEGPELQRPDRGLPGPVAGQGLKPDPEVLATGCRQQCLLALAVVPGWMAAARPADSTCDCTASDGAASVAGTAAAVVHLAAAPAPDQPPGGSARAPARWGPLPSPDVIPASSSPLCLPKRKRESVFLQQLTSLLLAAWKKTQPSPNSCDGHPWGSGRAGE